MKVYALAECKPDELMFWIRFRALASLMDPEPSRGANFHRFASIQENGSGSLFSRLEPLVMRTFGAAFARSTRIDDEETSGRAALNEP